jgi:hypothetical protein
LSAAQAPRDGGVAPKPRTTIRSRETIVSRSLRDRETIGLGRRRALFLAHTRNERSSRYHLPSQLLPTSSPAIPSPSPRRPQS